MEMDISRNEHNPSSIHSCLNKPHMSGQIRTQHSTEIQNRSASTPPSSSSSGATSMGAIHTPFSRNVETVTRTSHSNTSHKEMCQQLRSLIHDCLNKNHVTTASFYAEKLVSLSKHSNEDLWLLAQIHYRNREFKRAMNFIEHRKLLIYPPMKQTQYSLRFRLLMAQCMAESKMWEDCLNMIEAITLEQEDRLIQQAKEYRCKFGDEINIIASLCLQRGEAYEALESRNRAAKWYQYALKCDIYCSEAYFHLTQKHMLSTMEQKKLLESLKYHSDGSSKHSLILDLYSLQLGTFEANPSTSKRFESIENKYDLKESLDVMAYRAQVYYYQHEIEKAAKLSKKIYEQDPFNQQCIVIYVSCLVELGKVSELFYCAHKLVEFHQERALSWYAVGCYYLLIKKHDRAQRFFHKSTTIDSNFAPAWIGFGNSSAAQDESDQAMSSYRTASRLFPGSHLPMLYIGIEYLRTNSLSLSSQFIQQAMKISPMDPLSYNEMGVVYYKQGKYEEANHMFQKTLNLCEHLPRQMMRTWEPTMMNLGHVNRKLKRYKESISYFQAALSYCPKKASTHAALGFTYHMCGLLEDAIDEYHMALGLQPEDTLATEMLSRALNEVFTSGDALEIRPMGPSIPKSLSPQAKSPSMPSMSSPIRMMTPTHQVRSAQSASPSFNTSISILSPMNEPENSSLLSVSSFSNIPTVEPSVDMTLDGMNEHSEDDDSMNMSTESIDQDSSL